MRRQDIVAGDDNYYRCAAACRRDAGLGHISLGSCRKGGMIVIPGSFQYYAPGTIIEAASLLRQHGDEAKILSGGQSLIPLLKLRLASPRHLVDINQVPGLAYLQEASGSLRIGALVREVDLEDSDLIRGRYPILSDTSRAIADPVVRNLATVCGNLAHADPANDHPATMLALEAEATAVGPGGERCLPLVSFFTGPFTTALQADEILTEVRVPVPPPRSAGAYLKFERKVGDFATAAVAVQLTLGQDGTCDRIGIGLTNVGPVPIKARRAEAWLRGKPVEERTCKEAARLAAEESQPVSDFRGPAEYKRDLVGILTARALRKALERIAGGG